MLLSKQWRKTLQVLYLRDKTIGAPYNINEYLLPGKNATFTFKAGDEGVFRFYCTYHQPTMSGELVVLPRPAVEKTTPVTK